MKSDPLSDAKIKIERANANIQDVLSEHVAFFGNAPPHYTSFRELTADGTREALKIKIIRDPPPLFAAAVGDAVTNLRSALDYLTCQLAIQNGTNDVSKVEWPFASSPEAFASANTQKKIKGLSPEAVDLIRSQKPYRGGDDLLWSLNDLRNSNIHRHLVVSAITVTTVGGHLLVDAGIGAHTFEGPPPWEPSAREITFVTFTPGAKLNYNLQVAMDITFRDVGTVHGQSALVVLHQLSHLAQQILLKFEQRFFS
jgi:hypothetical protein